ncbi:N-acyl homoserine lactonase family protein [Paenibacillus naphthalenovorans]|uniref:N-acyl homoserine lactonase family protein n=1 Tax=Paenibacillus naphthalenovorans TaxID=162209 RepID=UPI00088C42AB|nr:N-acyl homoserine lactonase family protein [Paenibacillus naphthalenovorans]SDI40304.1 Glyoxylase, beta-lactamase superfamily II [Paenibacillus naphthalenovorans]
MPNPDWKIYPLLVGEADVPQVLDAFWSLSREKSLVSVPITAWLLVPQHGGEPILVDTGFRDAERCVQLQGLGPHRSKPEWTLKAQLSKYGYSLEDIPTVIFTHLHYDHAGGCGLLPRAKFIIQRTELQAAAAPMVSRELDFGGGALFYDRKDIAELIDPLWSRVHLIDGDEEIAPGVKCVLFSNTHTPGSQAVYVRTSAGNAVILGDIARKVELNVNKGIPPGLFYDLEAAYRAMKKIKRGADFVLPSHDYEELRKYSEGLPFGEKQA